MLFFSVQVTYTVGLFGVGVFVDSWEVENTEPT